jgi:hypothetical protein
MQDEDVVAPLIYSTPDNDALAAVVWLQHWGGSRRLTNALLGKEDGSEVDAEDKALEASVKQFIDAVHRGEWTPSPPQIVFGFVVAFYQLPHSDGFWWTNPLVRVLTTPIEVTEFPLLEYMPKEWKDSMCHNTKVCYDLVSAMTGPSEHDIQLARLLQTTKQKELRPSITRTLGLMTSERPDWLLKAVATKFQAVARNFIEKHTSCFMLLRVLASDQKNIVHFKIKGTTALRKLLSVYCERQVCLRESV